MTFSRETRLDLLERMRFDSGQPDYSSDASVRQVYLPIAEHLRALDPEVVLVVGDRGAGKSMLAHIAMDDHLRAAALRFAPSSRMPEGNVSWLRGWPLGSQGPDSRGWLGFGDSHSGARFATRDLWWAYLLRTVGQHLPAADRQTLSGLLEARGGDVPACDSAFRKVEAQALLVLDRLDERLAAEGRWLFGAYDELETAVAYKP